MWFAAAFVYLPPITCSAVPWLRSAAYGVALVGLILDVHAADLGVQAGMRTGRLCCRVDDNIEAVVSFEWLIFEVPEQKLIFHPAREPTSTEIRSEIRCPLCRVRGSSLGRGSWAAFAMDDQNGEAAIRAANAAEVDAILAVDESKLSSLWADTFVVTKSVQQIRHQA